MTFQNPHCVIHDCDRVNLTTVEDLKIRLEMSRPYKNTVLRRRFYRGPRLVQNRERCFHWAVFDRDLCPSGLLTTILPESLAAQTRGIQAPIAKLTLPLLLQNAEGKPFFWQCDMLCTLWSLLSRKDLPPRWGACDVWVGPLMIWY